MASECVCPRHGGIGTLDDDWWDTAQESADPLDDANMSAAYEQAIERGYPIDSPYRLDEAEQDARAEAHTAFVRRKTDEFARELGRALT